MVKNSKRTNNNSNTNHKLNYYFIICPRCGQIFDKKYNLIIHLQKENICEAKCIDVTQEKLQKNYDMYYNNFCSRFEYLLRRENKDKDKYISNH